jgi:hypothetical protein
VKAPSDLGGPKGAVSETKQNHKQWRRFVDWKFNHLWTASIAVLTKKLFVCVPQGFKAWRHLSFLSESVDPSLQTSLICHFGSVLDCLDFVLCVVVLSEASQYDSKLVSSATYFQEQHLTLETKVGH